MKTFYKAEKYHSPIGLDANGNVHSKEIEPWIWRDYAEYDPDWNDPNDILKYLLDKYAAPKLVSTFKLWAGVDDKTTLNDAIEPFLRTIVERDMSTTTCRTTKYMIALRALFTINAIHILDTHKPTITVSDNISVNVDYESMLLQLYQSDHIPTDGKFDHLNHLILKCIYH